MSLLFKPGSIFTSPPRALRPSDRACFQGIAFTINTAFHALGEIREITRKHDHSCDFDYVQKLALYRNTWVIIDQIHMLRQLLTALAKGKAMPKTMAEFIKLHAPATLLRNHMDHLQQKLKNFDSLKKSRSPIFGVLGYYIDLGEKKDELGQLVQFGKSILVFFGEPIQQSQLAKFVSPSGYAVCDPSGFFQISSFDQVYPFYRLDQDLPNLVTFLDTTIEENVIKKIKLLARTSGRNLEDLLAPHWAPSMFVCDMEG